MYSAIISNTVSHYDVIFTAWVDRLVDQVTFNVGESSKVVPLPIVDDDEVKGTRCVCLEVVANCYTAYSQLTPVTQTTVCVEDDDSESAALHCILGREGGLTTIGSATVSTPVSS